MLEEIECLFTQRRTEILTRVKRTSKICILCYEGNKKITKIITVTNIRKKEEKGFTEGVEYDY